MPDIQQDINQCLNILHTGGIILYPTDTIWGIGCDAGNPQAIERIFEIKQRSHNKSMIILVNDASMIYDFVRNPPGALIHQMTSAANPTTGIFENAKNLPPNLISSTGTVAIRIASDFFCKALIEQFGRPVVSTSANISNEPSPHTFSEIKEDLIRLVDYTVIYSRDDHSLKNPSQIIRLDTNGQVQRLR